MANILKSKKLRTAIVFFSILSVSLLAIFQFNLIPKVKAQSAIVTTSANLYSVSTPCQYKSFYANGRFWAFYVNTNAYYESTTDLADWSGATTSLRVCNTGPYFAVWFDGTYVHYILYDNYILYYRRGIPNSDGTITWSASEQTVHSGSSTDKYWYPTIAVDSNGYAWIGALYHNSTGDYPYVLKNANNDGTWSTDSGFPYQLSTISTDYYVQTIPLTAGKVYILYCPDNAAPLGKLYNGTWGSEESDLADYNFNAYGNYQFSAVSYEDDIHFVYNRETTYQLRYNNRTYGVGWGANDILVQDSMESTSAPALSVNAANDDLYCFWTKTDTDHVYYKKYNASTGTWDADPTDWIDESTDQIDSGDLLNSYYQAYGEYIGLLYVTKAVLPYNMKFAYLDSGSPTYSSISNSTDIAGAECTFNSLWDDNNELSYYIPSTNATGSWVNGTLTAFSSTPGWANFSATLPPNPDEAVGFRWYANDTCNNWNSTDIQTLTTTSMTITITYPQNTTYTSSSVPIEFTSSGGTIDKQWWNVKNASEWVYETNQTYTTPTTAEDFVDGSYQFWTYANNTGAASVVDNLNFTVDIPATPIYLTITSPTAVEYPTSSVYVELTASGGTVDTIWYNLKVSGEWIYETNQIYTAPTTLTLSNNVYALWAWANNTEGATGTKTVTFTVNEGSTTVPPQGTTTNYAVSIRVVRGTAPVPSATVILADITKTTDTQGYATFSVPAGTHNLKVIQNGATVYSNQLHIDEDGVWQVDLNQPDQLPQNITPEKQQVLPEIPSEIAQLGIVIIVAVILTAFFVTQSGKKSSPESEWRKKGKNIKRGEKWKEK